MTPFNRTSRLLTGAGLCDARLLPISAGGGTGLIELTAYDAAPVRLTNFITRCTP